MLILIYYGILIILAFMTWNLPFAGRILALGINLIIPEGLPFVDEFIQIVGILRPIINIIVRILRYIINIIVGILRYIIKIKVKIFRWVKLLKEHP